MSNEFKTQESLSQCKTFIDLKKWITQHAADQFVHVEATMYINVLASLMSKEKLPIVFEFSEREHRDSFTGVSTPGVNMVEFALSDGRKMGVAIYMYRGEVLKVVPAFPEEFMVMTPTRPPGRSFIH